MVELGRVDIITEVSMLAPQLANPREEHLEAVYRIYAYLDNKHNSHMSSFKECDWKDFYGEASEPLPTLTTEPRGKEIEIRL